MGCAQFQLAPVLINPLGCQYYISTNIYQHAYRCDFNEAAVVWISLTHVETVSVSVCFPLVLYTYTHSHSSNAIGTVLSEVQPELRSASQFVPMMFVPSKPEQLLRDLAPHPALSRSGTQWLLSHSLIPQ